MCRGSLKSCTNLALLIHLAGRVALTGMSLERAWVPICKASRAPFPCRNRVSSRSYCNASFIVSIDAPMTPSSTYTRHSSMDVIRDCDWNGAWHLTKRFGYAFVAVVIHVGEDLHKLSNKPKHEWDGVQAARRSQYSWLGSIIIVVVERTSTGLC